MSLPELLLISLVAVLVFGPKKLPMLARHLALIYRHLNQFKGQFSAFYSEQLNEATLIENQKKASVADLDYQKHGAANTSADALSNNPDDNPQQAKKLQQE